MAVNSDSFKPCPSRQKMVHFNADGTQTPTFRCTEPGAKLAYQDVTPHDCDVCPLRTYLVTTAPKHQDREPRKEHHIVSDGFLPCADRTMVDIQHCCGLTQHRHFCESRDCTHYSQEVSPAICGQCDVRREVPPSQ